MDSFARSPSVPSSTHLSILRYPIRNISSSSPSYPQLLVPLSDKPTELFYKGTCPSEFSQCLAVVGTRNMTSYGEFATNMFVRELVLHDFCIVSGLALGVDGEAHKAALRYGGKTMAVLAHGLDNVFPSEHTTLAQEILYAGGSLISEYPQTHPSLKFQFHMRNRIIAGLSLGVLVIEAGIRSGTQITARFAGEYGRPVFAVPGPITSQFSEGTKMFVNNGAKLVSCVKDILEELNIPLVPTALSIQNQEEGIQQTLYNQVFTRGVVTIDELVDVTQYSVSQIQSALQELQVLGKVRGLRGGKFSFM